MSKDKSVIIVSQDEQLLRKRTWKDTNFFIVLRQFARNKTALVGLIIIVLLILMAVLAPVIAPYDPAVIDPIHANEAPTAAHWFGTDIYGRDVLTRIMYGAQNSLMLGVTSGLLGTIVGIIFGTIAGYFGGAVESLILRICDVIQSIPNMLLCIIISQTMGRGIVPTVIALSFYSVPQVTRLLRSNILNLREQEFIEAERSINCSNVRIMASHILPNSLSPVIVSFTLTIGMKIIQSAGLSYLGLGIQDPTAEWGAMIALGKNQLRYAPHEVLFPGLFVALVVLAFNIAGDGLRDALDPKSRR